MKNSSLRTSIGVFLHLQNGLSVSKDAGKCLTSLSEVHEDAIFPGDGPVVYVKRGANQIIVRGQVSAVALRNICFVKLNLLTLILSWLFLVNSFIEVLIYTAFTLPGMSPSCILNVIYACYLALVHSVVSETDHVVAFLAQLRNVCIDVVYH